MKIFSKRRLLFGVLIVVVGLFAYAGIDNFTSIRYSNGVAATSSTEDKAQEVQETASHIQPPEPLKAIYMSQCVAGTPSFRDQLIELINTTELNAVVIDIKDFSGKLGFPPEDPQLSGSVSDECGAFDMKELLERLHGDGIYVVARITVFQDPFYAVAHPELAVLRKSDGAVWKDYKGLSFIDVGAKAYWDYIVSISQEAYELGFDELNYDYIRYPSDGNMKDIAFTHSATMTKADALEGFFSYLYAELVDGKDYDERPKLSADLFGYTTTNVDDLGIGQVIERALPYFDYVMPMVYPSHYNKGFIGIDNPAAYPYEVVKYSMDSAVRRANKIALAADSTATSTEVLALKEISQKGHGNVNPTQLRPWLQDFDLGATYTPEMVKAQIQATYDAGLTSWSLWDAGNTYTKAALVQDRPSD